LPLDHPLQPTQALHHKTYHHRSTTTWTWLCHGRLPPTRPYRFRTATGLRPPGPAHTGSHGSRPIGPVPTGLARTAATAPPGPLQPHTVDPTQRICCFYHSFAPGLGWQPAAQPTLHPVLTTHTPPGSSYTVTFLHSEDYLQFYWVHITTLHRPAPPAFPHYGSPGLGLPTTCSHRPPPGTLPAGSCWTTVLTVLRWFASRFEAADHRTEPDGLAFLTETGLDGGSSFPPQQFPSHWPGPTWPSHGPLQDWFLHTYLYRLVPDSWFPVLPPVR